MADIGALRQLLMHLNPSEFSAADRAVLLPFQDSNNFLTRMRGSQFIDARKANNQELANQIDKVLGGHHYIGSTLSAALTPKKYLDDDMRVLLAPHPQQDDFLTAAMQYHVPGERTPSGEPFADLNNGVYTDTFGSVMPGAGKEVMRVLSEMYPDTPMTLHAAPGADAVYSKWGFKRAPRGMDPTGDSILPYMYLEQGRDLKKRGGLVQYKESVCGC